MLVRHWGPLMSKRAVLIITDGFYVDGVTLDSLRSIDDFIWLETSEQLLADLRTLVKAGEWATTIADWDPHRRKENEIAVARVRALLPKGES